MADFRVGIDFGGTKIEIIAIAADGSETLRRRVPNPLDYGAAIRTIRDLVEGVETELNGSASVGVGIPGAVSPDTGLVKNANSTWLNGQPFARDLSISLGREVKVENDANCFALSEAVDGAGAGQSIVFGVIIGTGVGGGIVVNERVLVGRHSIAGEWGHTPLPWPKADETPGIPCFCGNTGCAERYLAGPSLAEDCDGPGHRDASAIPARAEAGDPVAIAALDRHVERLARGLAQIVNILDPHVIVLGGGLSNMRHLYERVPPLLQRHVISPHCTTPIRQNLHGDSSGVRGAAWLWPRDRPLVYRTSGS